MHQCYHLPFKGNSGNRVLLSVFSTTLFSSLDSTLLEHLLISSASHFYLFLHRAKNWKTNYTTLAKLHLNKTFVLVPATRGTNNAEAFHTHAAGPDPILANSTNCQSDTVLSKIHITKGLIP